MERMKKAGPNALEERKRKANEKARVYGHVLGAWEERGESIVAQCQNPGCRASSSIGTAVNGIAIGSALHPNPRTNCPLRRS